MLDKSGKPVSCVKVYNDETKQKVLLNPSILFFIDPWGLLLIERKGIHCAKASHMDLRVIL